MAYLGTPGSNSGNLHTEYLQERNGNFTGGTFYEPFFLMFVGDVCVKLGGRYEWYDPCCGSCLCFGR